MTGIQIAQLDALERRGGADEVDRMLDLMSEVSADAEGLRFLVERYGTSTNEAMRGMLAICVSHACWTWNFEDEELPRIVFRFAPMLMNTPTPGTLISTVGALQGLSRRGILRPGNDEERAAFGAFVLDCAGRDDWFVLSTVVDTLVHIHCDDQLLEPLLNQHHRQVLATRLAELADDPDYSSGLKALQPFWHG